jgi:hypothetical protein
VYISGCLHIFSKCTICGFFITLCSEKDSGQYFCLCSSRTDISIFVFGKEFLFSFLQLTNYFFYTYFKCCSFCSKTCDVNQEFLHLYNCIFSISAATDSKRKCLVCLENGINICFLPCRHSCCCTRCANRLEKCPICRTMIKFFCSINLPE